MSFIVWIIFGLIVGAAADWFYPSKAQGGFLGAVVLGIFGAVSGGFFANILLELQLTGFNLTSLTISILGALLLILLGRVFKQV